MPLLDKLTRVNELQATIHRQGKLPAEVLKRINFKFRLEWNYHSNSMEGNSLTRQETRTVMVGNITLEGKAIRDDDAATGRLDSLQRIAAHPDTASGPAELCFRPYGQLAIGWRPGE